MALLTGACASGGVTVETMQPTVDRINQQFTTALVARDVATLSSMYSEDPIVMASNVELLRGRESVGQFLSVMVNQYKPSQAAFTTVDLEVHGDVAIETGTYTMTLNPPNSPPIPDRGKYLVVLKRGDDGAWRLHRDIFNTSLPMPEPDVKAATTVPSEIASAHAALLRAWGGRDVSAFRAYYAADAVAVNDMDRFVGISDIEARWIAPVLPHIENFSAMPSAFLREGNAISEIGSYAFKLKQPDGSVQNATGTYTHIWKPQTDGTWKVAFVTVS
ncbi:MAG: DUF4440 domain-containing protein [Gemmatimonadota bacterium]